MGSLDFFSQYNRFQRGIVSPWEFATWILQHADEMERVLADADWDLYLEIELIAAEFTSSKIDEEMFCTIVRERLGSISPTVVSVAGEA